MKEVEVNVDVASDGSGYRYNTDLESREAFIKSIPSETYLGSGYILAVPMTAEEKEVYTRNVETHEGVECLMLKNVKSHYIIGVDN